MSNWRLRRDRRVALLKAKTLHNTAQRIEKRATRYQQDGSVHTEFVKGMIATADTIRFEAEHEEYHAFLLESLLSTENNVSRETST